MVPAGLGILRCAPAMRQIKYIASTNMAQCLAFVFEHVRRAVTNSAVWTVQEYRSAQDAKLPVGLICPSVTGWRRRKRQYEVQSCRLVPR